MPYNSYLYYINYVSTAVEEGFTVMTDPLIRLIRTGDSFTVVWSNQTVIPGVDPALYTVNITLFCLNDPEREIRTETATLASNVSNTGQAQVTVPNLSIPGMDVCAASVQVGFGGPVSQQTAGDELVRTRRQVTLSQALARLGRIGRRAGIWSIVVYVAVSPALRFLCDQWFDREPPGIGEELNRQVQPCPPTRDQALRDNRFTMENPILSQIFHPNTGGCFRQRVK